MALNKPPHEEKPDWNWEDDHKAGCGKHALLLLIGIGWGLAAFAVVVA